MNYFPAVELATFQCKYPAIGSSAYTAFALDAGNLVTQGLCRNFLSGFTTSTSVPRHI